MAERRETIWAVTWRPRLGRAGRLAVGLAAGKTIRLVIILLSGVMVWWLLYGNVWRPLQQPVGLPPGVSRQNPVLDSGWLQGIVGSRLEREAHRPRSYGIYSRLFVVGL